MSTRILIYELAFIYLFVENLGVLVMFRLGITGLVSGVGGVYLGAKEPDKVVFFKNKLYAMLQGEDGQSNATGAKAIDCTAEELMDKAWDLTKASGEFAVLSTVNSSGGISSRYIQPFEIEGTKKDPQIFFNTLRQSRKAAELKNNPQVTLTYVNSAKMHYVCWKGACTEVPAPDHKKHWREWLRVFYPEGPDGGRFTTWVVTPSAVEAVSISESLVSRCEDNRPPQLGRKKDKDQGWERTD